MAPWTSRLREVAPLRGCMSSGSPPSCRLPLSLFSSSEFAAIWSKEWFSASCLARSCSTFSRIARRFTPPYGSMNEGRFSINLRSSSDKPSVEKTKRKAGEFIEFKSDSSILSLAGAGWLAWGGGCVGAGL